MAGRVLGAITVAATSGLALLALAIPASAHTPSSKAECVGGKTVLSVTLKDYARRDNTIVVKDGTTELVNTSFGDRYEKSWTTAGDVAHTFTITVKASDGNQFNYSKTHKVDACVKPTSSSSTTTTTTTTTTTSSSSESTPPSSTSESTPPAEVTTTTTGSSSSETVPVTTTTTPVAGGGGEAQPPLASTGASPGWALLAGLGLVGAGAGAVFVVRRKRAA